MNGELVLLTPVGDPPYFGAAAAATGADLESFSVRTSREPAVSLPGNWITSVCLFPETIVE